MQRERPQAQLSELGTRMLPLLKQCYDSASLSGGLKQLSAPKAQ